MTRAGLKALLERVERGDWLLAPWPRSRPIKGPLYLRVGTGCVLVTTYTVAVVKRGQKGRSK